MNRIKSIHKLAMIVVLACFVLSATFFAQAALDDFTTITWSTVAPQPYRNSEGQSAVVNNLLYSFGGFDSTRTCCTPTRRVYVYNPVSNVWTALRDMPKGLTHAGLTTDGVDIFYAGGYIENAARTGQIFGTREAWRYNVASNTYTALPSLPVERAAGQLAYLNGELHYFGGTNMQRTQDVGDHYVLNLNGGTTWTTAAALPNPRHHIGAAVLNGKIYAIGGQHGHDGALVPEGAVHAYDPATNSWTQLASISPARNHITSSTVVLAGRIIVLGGQVNHNAPVNNVNAYNPVTNTWTSLTPLPAARHSAVAGVLNNQLFFSTGNTAVTYKGIPVDAPPPAVQAVTSLTLINADTDQAIANLSEGYVIDFAAIGTQNLSIRANTSPATVGSVRFQLDANANFRTENQAPYAIAGDSNQTNYGAWIPSLGAHTIGATPYTLSNGGGTVGTALTFNIMVVNNTEPGLPSHTPTSTSSPTSTSTATTTSTPTNTSTPTATSTPTSTPTATSTPPPTFTPIPGATEEVIYRINSGGGLLTTSGITWSADQNFVGGKTNNLPNNIAGTTDDALYTTERSSTANTAGFSYALPVAAGTYTVKLYFSELWFVGGSGRGTPGIGKRIFDVNIEGVTVLDNYDVTADVGILTATIKTFSITVSDGTLNIDFPPASADRPTIGAIEVLRPATSGAPAGFPAPVNPPAIQGIAPSITPTWTLVPTGIFTETSTSTPTETATSTATSTSTSTPTETPLPTATQPPAEVTEAAPSSP